MSSLSRFAAVVATALVAGGCAVTPAPSQNPAEARPQRVRLPNGLTVILKEHRAADVAAVQLWVRVGARDETDAGSGLSHFIEHLLFKGTPTRGPGMIDRTISGVGGEINAATSQDFTYYRVVVPARHVGTALDVVADAAANAAFDPAETERERLVVLEEIRRAHDNPGGYLWRFLARHHFAGHPYGRPVLGAPESIRAARREQIVEYYRRHYVPNNATVVVVGNVAFDRVLTQVGKGFAGWEPRPIPAAVPPAPPDPAAIRRAEEPRPLQQVYLGVAWRGPVVPETHVYAVDLLTSILGRGRASRLNQALKEERGLVSSVGASFSAQREAGVITVTARTTPARRHEVEPALLAEVERLRTTLVSEAELARALTAVEAGYAFGQETAEGLAHAYGLAETVWTLEFELGYLEAVRRVTREEIREAARRYLTPDRYTAAALLPRDGTP
ncbi:MAG: insulinase family protein [Candidatus Rokubacteria bacterium]|nr:insulinase family protein [Candidatus Rokubacteria bacterium]